MRTVSSGSTVQLDVYSEIYKERLQAFHLSEHQLEFTSLPLAKISNPVISSSTIHVIILHNEQPAGYFALEDGEKLRKYSANDQARLITSFSIDTSYQGQGIAKEGLKLLPEFIREIDPGINEIVLGVNKRNTAAINLYFKAGFEDEDEVYHGPKGPQHILHLKI